MKLAIADPPYPPYPPYYAERRDRPGGPIRVYTRSRAQRWYGTGTKAAEDLRADYHPDAAEWDNPARHRALLEQLVNEYDGWAIATTPDGIQHYMPLPIPTRIMSWHKRTGQPGNHRLRSSWEPVLVYVPECRRGGKGEVSDTLTAAPRPDRFAGSKPPEWSRWISDALGYDPETDQLDDLFPGSGAVATALLQGVLL